MEVHPGQAAHQGATQTASRHHDKGDKSACGQVALTHWDAREAVQLAQHVVLVARQGGQQGNQGRDGNGP
jgi:hypothetical protein